VRFPAVLIVVLAACGSGGGASQPDAGVDAEPRTFCGDSFPDPGEECDDGNDVDTDGCIDCVAATCGDGIVRAVVEECDDASATCLGCSTCASGVIDPATGHCYAVVDQAGTRAAAQAACAAIEGHLAAIDSAAEWTAIAPLWTDPYPSRWVGLTRAVDGQNLWRWETGAPLEIAAARWNPGEPNDAGAIEDCVESGGVDGLWNDLACDQVRAALCERPGWTVDPVSTHAYRVFYALRTHPEAVADCAARGAHLTAITNAREQAFVAGFAPFAVWIGAFQGATENDWFWPSAEPFEFSAWAPGQPDDFNAAEDCAHLFADGTWNDNACTARLPYLCEAD
jgi:cysteine-rich repeat protein